MLLETLDVKKNDVIIYSKNKFDLDDNFKIIFKDDPEKKPRKISFGDVCDFVNEYTPKNLIVYRLLTNFADFKIEFSKYGYLININGSAELVYFDPIFAVKELEDYSHKIDFSKLRFRIQQVGLTTLNRINNSPNYAEIYSIDLEAVEAKYQKDQAFVEAIFAKEKKFAKYFTSEDKNLGLKKVIEKKKSLSDDEKKQLKTAQDKNKVKVSGINHLISEDKDFDHSKVKEAVLNKKSSLQSRPGKDKIKDENAKSVIPKVVKKDKINSKDEHANLRIQEPSKNIIDIFKTPDSRKNYLEEKDKKVVLKLKKK